MGPIVFISMVVVLHKDKIDYNMDPLHSSIIVVLMVTKVLIIAIILNWKVVIIGVVVFVELVLLWKVSIVSLGIIVLLKPVNSSTVVVLLRGEVLERVNW